MDELVTVVTGGVSVNTAATGADCQILRFNRLSTCVEAHWFRLHHIWNILYRIFCVTYLSGMYEYKYDTSTRLIRVQLIVQPSLAIATCLVFLSLVATTTSST